MNAVSEKPGTPRNVSLLGPEAGPDEVVARLQRVTELAVMYPRLQRLCRPQSETFWVLGGRPGAFKTALLWNLALNAAVRRQRVLFVSLEMTPAEMYLLAISRFSGLDRRRIARAFAGKDPEPFTGDEQAKWDEGVHSLKALELVMRMHGADEHGRSLDDVLRSACRSRFDAVFVDHLGMIGRDSAGRELDVLAHAIHRLRGLSRGEVVKGYRPWVVATSQLNREIDKGDEDRIPRLSDFRGSARIEHDADVAIGLQKRKRAADDEDPTSILDGFVLKNRNGPPGVVLLFEANGATGLVVERRPEEPPPPDHWSQREPGED